jgi:uncharacterized protein YukE
MARLKRSSNILETARQRLAGLKSITPAPDFGGGLTIAAYEQDINSFSASLNNYNEKVAALDDLQNQLQAAEDALRDKNKRMLSAVEAQFGPDSSQYEQAGGTRQSERKRPARKATTKG